MLPCLQLQNYFACISCRKIVNTVLDRVWLSSMTSGGTLGRVLLRAHRNGTRPFDGISLLAAVGAQQHSRASFATSSSGSSGPPPTGDLHTSEQLSQINQQLFGSSCADIQDVTAAATSSFAAAQPFEPLAQLLNPAVLGSSIWELAHSATGLPWWASIPLTTFAMRTMLLPLTLKAKSAGLNWVLLQNSFQTANLLLHQMQQQQTPQSSPAAAAAAAAAVPGDVRLQQQQLKKPSKLKLVREYYRYFKKQHKTTSMGWWLLNAGVQANLFVVMSVALRQMADAQWPGMTTEGLGWFADLTNPAVVWGSWSSAGPYGPAGYLIPLGLVGLYKSTVDQSPAVRSFHMQTLLYLGCLPYFIMSCLVPQATLLYWLGNNLFFYAMQAALMKPKVARAAGLPTIMLPIPRGPTEERERAEMELADTKQLVCGSEDDKFLRVLVSNYLARGKHQQALLCLQRLTVLAPGDLGAFSDLGRTAAELQQWPAAAAAYERAAELAAAAGEVEDQAVGLVLAGKHWLNAVAECRQLQKAAKERSSKHSGCSSSSSSSSPASASQGSAGSSGNDSSSNKSAYGVVQLSKQQAYITAALRTLEAAVALPAEAAAEGRYLLAMAYTAAQQRDEALAVSRQYWENTCRAAADGDATAKSNAAAKLLPVLANLCKQYHASSEDEALMSAATLAVEVAQAGWDRQSQEQLHDMLGTAAQAASALGRFAYAEQLKQLQQKLGHGPARQQKQA